MITIHKFPVDRSPFEYGYLRVEMPEGAEVLSVIMQGDRMVLYAKVDDDQMNKVERVIYIAGTGKEMPAEPDYKFIGTVQDSSWVWHVFVRIDNSF